MKLSQRLRAARAASLAHLGASALVAAACAALVFGLWYPYPYNVLVGGRELFLLVVAVDVVMGPLLTLVVYDRRKPLGELVRDMGLIVLLQCAALAYGLHTVAQARPVFLAFEGDRFRVVRPADIDDEKLAQARPEAQRLGFTGPRPMGVKLAQPTDRDFPASIQLSLAGEHPAFRPERWVPYDLQRSKVITAARPLSQLREKHVGAVAQINEAVQKAGVAEERLGFLPLLAGAHTEWVVLVSLDDARPLAYLPLDGFF